MTDPRGEGLFSPPAGPADRRVAFLWLAFVVCVSGVVVGRGGGVLLASAIAGVAVVAAVWVRPHLGVVGAALAVGTAPVLLEQRAFLFGSVNVFWSDLALAGLLIAALSSITRIGPNGLRRVTPIILWAAPFLVILAVNAAMLLLDGERIQTVARTLRFWAWYAAVPAAAVCLTTSRARRTLVDMLLLIGAVTSVLVIVGNMWSPAGVVLARLTGAGLVLLPGNQGNLARLVLPGMTFVPFGLAYCVGLVLRGGEGRSKVRAWALGPVYAAGLLVTFARGMWLWTLVGLLAAAATAMTTRSAVRLVGVALVGLLVLGVADAWIGRTPQMPDGLVGLVADRIGEISGGDLNTDVRHEEDREAVRQAAENPLMGVGLVAPVGRFYYLDREGIAQYYIHNSYYEIYARLGILGVAAVLLLFAPFVSAGFRMLSRADPGHAPVLFAAVAGLVRGLCAAWTQQDLSNVTGVFALAACAGLIAWAPGRPGGARESGPDATA